MATEFLSARIWPRLRRLARTRGRRAYVAVPFLGKDAAKRLPLRQGDVLITKFDLAAVRAGLVSPTDVVAFITRGVEVHSVANLHAKVYVFGRTAFVGSANVSASSEESLIEAGCEVTSSDFVAACRAFVQSLRGEIVELKFARSLIPFWRPAHTPYRTTVLRTSHRVRQSDLVAVSLHEVNYDAADEAAADRAHRSARTKLRDRETFRLDDFRWDGRVPKALRFGSRVLMCTARSSGATDITAPARVLEIRRYKGSRGGWRAIIVVEVRKHLREKRKSMVLKALGASGKPLRSMRRMIVLTNATLIYRLGQLWPTSGAR